HPDLGARVREHDVRRDGRAVQEVVDVGETEAGLLAERADAVGAAASGVVGGGGDLVDGDPAGVLVDEDQVGERAADVDAEALHAGIAVSAGTIDSPTRRIWSRLLFR